MVTRAPGWIERWDLMTQVPGDDTGTGHLDICVCAGRATGLRFRHVLIPMSERHSTNFHFRQGSSRRVSIIQFQGIDFFVCFLHFNVDRGVQPGRSHRSLFLRQPYGLRKYSQRSQWQQSHRYVYSERNLRATRPIRTILLLQRNEPPE